MSNSRSYPYTAWRLLLGGKPDTVTIVESSYGLFSRSGWVLSESGKRFNLNELSDSKDEAIERGFAECDKRLDNITKMQARLKKVIATLEKYK